jgi:hypothetical protein
VCRELHQQPEVKDLFGEYRSDQRDPSATMIAISVREYNPERMRKACQLMDRGKGLKAAAAEVYPCNACFVHHFHKNVVLMREITRRSCSK